MDERTYDGLIARYAPSWNAPAAASAPVAALRAIDADRQTHQCGFSDGGLDPAGQHHDAGAGHRRRTAARAAPLRRPRLRRAAPPKQPAASTILAPQPRGAVQTGARGTGIYARAGSARARRAGSGGVERLMLSKASRRSLTSHHAASSHQACRRLRIRQGTQGLGRRAHADREEKRPAASSYSHHPDDAEAGRGDRSRAARSIG